MVNGLEFIVYHINIHKAKYGKAYSFAEQIYASYDEISPGQNRTNGRERDKCPFWSCKIVWMVQRLIDFMVMNAHEFYVRLCPYWRGGGVNCGRRLILFYDRLFCHVIHWWHFTSWIRFNMGYDCEHFIIYIYFQYLKNTIRFFTKFHDCWTGPTHFLLFLNVFLTNRRPFNLIASSSYLSFLF